MAQEPPFSRRGEVGTVDNGGSGVTSTAVASVGLIRRGMDPCYARILQKGARGWRDSGDLRITEHRTEKPETELPSKMGKQRTSRETPFCKKSAATRRQMGRDQGHERLSSSFMIRDEGCVIWPKTPRGQSRNVCQIRLQYSMV
jgi:hypothetical protein